MENLLFRPLKKQIEKTEELLDHREAFGMDRDEGQQMILENQLHIMKALDEIVDEIYKLPR